MKQLLFRKRAFSAVLGLALAVSLPLLGGAQTPAVKTLSAPVAAVKPAPPQIMTAYYGVYIQSAKVGSLVLSQDRGCQMAG